MALVDGFIGLGQFASPAYLRPAVQELMAKVSIVPDAALGEFGAQVDSDAGRRPDADAVGAGGQGLAGLPHPGRGSGAQVRGLRFHHRGPAGGRRGLPVIMALERERDLERLLQLLVATPDEDQCC